MARSENRLSALADELKQQHNNEIVVVRSFEQEATEIAKRGITVYVDDQDEILMHVPEDVTVLKIRNGGNYDYDSKKCSSFSWIGESQLCAIPLATHRGRKIMFRP